MDYCHWKGVANWDIKLENVLLGMKNIFGFKKTSLLQENEARGIFQQLILAVDYCHRMGVANRDIKLENVLLGGDKRSPVIKLTDFGFSKSELDSVPTTICGTPGYMGVRSCTISFPVICSRT